MILLWLLACSSLPFGGSEAEDAQADVDRAETESAPLRLGSAADDAGSADPTDPSAEDPSADPSDPAQEVAPVALAQHHAPPAPKPPADAILLPEDCEVVPPGAPPQDGCLTGTLSCGEELVGHTLGGVQRYDTRFYEKQFCTPSITSDHDGGGERLYRLEVPEGDWRVKVTLDTPCTDLDLAVMKWDKGGCPEPDSKVFQCEMARQDGKKREQVQVSSRGGSTWLLLVEPNGTEQGAYGLRVECTPGL